MKSRKLCRACPHRKRRPGTVLNLDAIGIGEHDSHLCHMGVHDVCEGSLQRLDLLRDGRCKVEAVPMVAIGEREGGIVGVVRRV